MIFHLIKKDMLIIKKYVLMMMAIAVLIPLLLVWRAPGLGGITYFLLSVIFTELILWQYVSQKENQYSKASSLLCAAPYSRRELVQAKYILYLLIFLYCYVVYVIEASINSELAQLSFIKVFGAFLFITACYGVYMPIQYKLGFEKTKFFFIIVLMGSPLILPVFTSGKIRIDTSALLSISPFLRIVLLAFLGIAVWFISMEISIKIYDKKDLL